MKLDKERWIKVPTGKVVAELRESCKEPIKKGFSNYVGFEHIEPENLNLKSFGDLNDGVTFSKTFKKGDVLFGKIRAYLKKVAVAPIDGICSGDILVLRTKDEGTLSQTLLPYYFQTQSFLNKAIGTSIGTTLPRTKWQHLAKHEISIPPHDDQKRLVSLFDSLQAGITLLEEQEKQIKGLWINLIDEFINDKPSFGDLLYSKILKTVRFCEVAEKVMRKIDPISFGIERIVAGENLESEDFKIRTWQKIGEGYLGPAFHVLFKPGDILYGSRRTYLKKVSFADFKGICANTTYVIRAKEDILLQDLLKHVMLSDRFTRYSIGVSKGSTNPYINWKDLDNFIFQLPDIETQKEIVRVLDDIVDLIEDLKKQRLRIKTLKQNLLNEILG